MTISLRNRFFAAASVVSVGSLIGFAVISLRLYFRENEFSVFSTLPDETGNVQAVFWGMTPYIASYFRIALSLLSSAATMVFITVYFRKTVSSEIFFFSAFAFSPVFEAVRLLVPMVATPGGLPIPVLAAVTKVALFGRVFGTFSLFLSAVYATGFKYEKLERMFGITALAALAVTGAVPVNTSVPLVTFSFELGYSGVIAAVVFFMKAMAVGNYALAARLNQSREFLVAGAGALACSLGREALHFAPNPAVTIAGAALFCGGGMVLIRKMHDYYLWT